MPTVGTFELFDRALLALPSAESRLFRAAQGLQIGGPDKSLVSHTIQERSMDFAAGEYGSPDDPYFGEGRGLALIRTASMGSGGHLGSRSSEADCGQERKGSKWPHGQDVA